MSCLAQELHINQLASNLKSCLSSIMGHRKVKFGTCSAPLSDTSHCCRYYHRCYNLSPLACRHYSYSQKRSCTRTVRGIKTCAVATHNANGKILRNTTATAFIATNNAQEMARTAATIATKSRQDSKMGLKTPALTLFALLNLALLAPYCREVASAPAPANAESSIKVTRFQVPAQVRPGEQRKLTCLYELNGATLHAMKLFKDDKEFYRFTPSPSAPSDRKMTFPVVGVHVELNRSNDREVQIRTNKRSSGQYKCQVSIEGTFNSVSAEKRMEVVDGNQFGSGATIQASSGHLAGASLWQQQYDTTSAQRQQQQQHFQGPMSMMSPRAKQAGQRQGYPVSSAARSSGAMGRVGFSSNSGFIQQISNLAWPILILVSLLVQIAATNGATIVSEGARRTESGHELDLHLSHHPPPSSTGQSQSTAPG